MKPLEQPRLPSTENTWVDAYGMIIHFIYYQTTMDFRLTTSDHFTKNLVRVREDAIMAIWKHCSLITLLWYPLYICISWTLRSWIIISNMIFLIYSGLNFGSLDLFCYEKDSIQRQSNDRLLEQCSDRWVVLNRSRKPPKTWYIRPVKRRKWIRFIHYTMTRCKRCNHVYYAIMDSLCNTCRDRERLDQELLGTIKRLTRLIDKVIWKRFVLD